MKVHQKLFWLLIFLLPVQLGKHFWPQWTQVLGLPIDYLSPTIYLTDILVMAILFFWWLDSKKNDTLSAIRQIAKNHWWVGAVFLYLLITSLLAQNPGVALYKFIKITEFTFLGFYIVKNSYLLSASPLRGIPSECRYPLSLAVIYSSLIAMIQFIKQASLGGIFWWLGERTFSLMTPGIAKAVISGQLVMRPYATFPHPNVLAGFMLVSLILIGIRNQESGIRKILHWLTIALGVIAIAISFSRSTWLVGLLVGLVAISSRLGGGARKRAISRHLRGEALVLASLIIIGMFFFFARDFSGQEAFVQRLALIRIAIKMISANPLAGVGLNNFIPQLPNYWQQFGMTYWLQPVHNIFLLISAETGLTGLTIFLWFLILTFKNLLEIGNWKLVIPLLAILLTGVADHYWLTLQQPQLLFTLILGLSWRR